MNRIRLCLAAVAGCAAIAWLALPAGAQQATASTRCSDGAATCFARGLSIVTDSIVRRREAGAGWEQEAQLWQRALELFDAACAAGSASACYSQGRVLLSISALDTARARLAADLYARTCTAPSVASSAKAAACNGLGEAYFYGMGRPVSKDTAVSYYEQGCRLGDATACFRAAARYAEIGGYSEAEATRLYNEGQETACRRRSETACLNIATTIENEHLLQKPEPAQIPEFMRRYHFVRDEYRRICKAGVPFACTYLAHFIETRGDSLSVGPNSTIRFSPDTSTAMDYNRLACLGQPPRGSRDGRACQNLGLTFIARALPDSAHVYFRLGCEELFYSPSCASLAVQLIQADQSEAGSGSGATRFSEALRLLATTCFEDYNWGCYRTGELLNSAGDPSGALGFFVRACDLAYNWGCYRAGQLAGTHARNPNLVFKYQRRGCELNASYACIALAQALEKSTAEASAVARYHARGCELAVERREANDFTGSGCWAAMLWFSEQADEAEAARHHALACRSDAKYCKKVVERPKDD